MPEPDGITGSHSDGKKPPESEHSLPDEPVDQKSRIPSHVSVPIQVGFIATEDRYEGERVIEAVKNTLHRLENILAATPHSYRFILPLHPGPEHVILEALLADPCWEHCTSPEIIVVAEEDTKTPTNCPFEGEIKYTTELFSPEDTTPGFDPTADTIMDLSNLILLVGEWEPGSTRYRPGTVFDLARNHGRTIVTINPDTGATDELAHDDRIFTSYKQLNDYNEEYISRRRYAADFQRYQHMLREEAEKAGLPEDIIKPIYASLLPQFTRTKILAKKYRRLYSLTGNLVSALAAMAVATITFQTLFLPTMPILVWLEVLEIALIILCMSASRYGDFHRKWMDYNFLAERVRAAFFLCICCINCKKPEAPPHMSLAHRPNDWMVMAFESVIETRPVSFCRLDIPFDPMKRFFLSAWISNRLHYYEKAGSGSGRQYLIFTIIGEGLFVGTLFLAVVHALGIGHWELQYNIELATVLAFLTISLPAIGSAVAAIRVQREYLRNAERYSHVVRHLTAIRNQIRHARTMAELSGFLEEVNEITLREQQDWRIIFRFRGIEKM